ncbi:ISL3 family transposase [Streptomyces sp. NBC_00620]|uniref:ISL3 family transposase n=1 Tax=Streptomyces sp. NBC_00620 TaxID=2903666 RepID=UPI00224F5E16|nr:ISL3 family transposase [Streptomyces sp. NBC_00620]MCX4973702.1 ISL3 family transposase [Streptomyces sp. NBC_00620]
MLGIVFPHLEKVLVERVSVEDGVVRVVARSREGVLPCPNCGLPSGRVHSWYRRHLADAAVGGRQVVIDLSVRRLFCDAAVCARRTFAEQVDGLTIRYGRRTVGLAGVVQAIALALAGRAGARLAAVLHIVVSRVTLLNAVMALPDSRLPTPRVLGVDDFATRRGRRYGTVMVDVESRAVVDLLPGREKETVAIWLSGHPGIEVICRDRAGGYAEAARSGAPGAVQVADRWHLWDNLRTAVERAVITHRSCLSAPELDLASDRRMATSPPGNLNPDTGLEKWLVTRTRERHREVQRLLARGWTISAIGRELGLARHTAGRYANCENLEGLVERAIRRTRLDDYKPYLIRRWNEGCTDAARLFREIQAQGYPGRTPQAVRRYLRPLRTSLGSIRSPAPVLKPQQVANWIMWNPERLHLEEQLQLTDVLLHCPELNAVRGHVHTFAQMVRDLAGDRLPAWMDAVHADDLPTLHAFADGLQRDHDAVMAGLTLPWSSGPVEGHVNRIKMLKRQMYGRAGFALLRKRVLLA